jgi:hypothetical protein
MFGSTVKKKLYDPALGIPVTLRTVCRADLQELQLGGSDKYFSKDEQM